MIRKRCRRVALGLALGLAAMVSGPGGCGGGTAQAAEGTDNADALRRAAQNPVANMISIPFQNNTSFDYGPEGGTQNVLNIQPVIPVHLNEDWNLITRWVTPVIWQPAMAPGQDGTFGIGNIQPTFFLSPAGASRFIWGVGPALWLPTATDGALGLNKWGGGPSIVALMMEGPWVAGVLANNIWAGTEGERINQGLVQPFVNYNMKDGWYLVSAPIVTANWRTDGGNAWTVPVGGGVGRLFRVGELPINAQVQGFYNALKPDTGSDFQMRLQVQLLLPQK